MNHVSVSPTDGTGPTQGQRKTLTRVGVTSPPLYRLSYKVRREQAIFRREQAICFRREQAIFSSHGLLPSDLVTQSVERQRSNPKVVGSIPTLVRVFLCPCVGPVPSVGLTLTWFIWDRNLALHVTLHSLQLILLKI